MNSNRTRSARNLVIGSWMGLGLLLGCSGAASTPTTATDALARGESIACVPVDSDEGCSESANFCVAQLVLTSLGGGAAALSIERSRPDDGEKLSAITRDRSTSFSFGARNLKAKWTATESVDATSSDGGKVYVGSASVAEAGSFLVECRKVGAAPNPSVRPVAGIGERCNYRDASGALVRCVASTYCSDESANEIPQTSSREGTCQHHVVLSAGVGEACNVNPHGTQNLVACQSGLVCRDAAGDEIPLAPGTPAGTCYESEPTDGGAGAE